MPYIKQKDRNELRVWYGMNEHADGPISAGELNYVFTQVALNYLEENGENYQAYNDILGALEGAKLELYRRRVAPYEDKKIEENGDVY